MKKSTIIALSVTGSLVLVTCIALSIYFAMKSSSANGPTPLSPQEQCNKNGYIWDPVKQECTTNQCVATVDPATGVLSGTMVNLSGTACVDVSSGAYLSPFARASLLQVCQDAGFQNVGTTSTGVATGLVCTKASGCDTKPYVTNTFMDGCPYLTYRTSGASCVPPTNDQLEYLCNTSINGCPINTNLNQNCPSGQPCFDAIQGCQAQLDTPGCRPQNEMWQWMNGQCVNATVSNTIAVTVTTARVDIIEGTFVLDNLPQTTKVQWRYLLTNTTKTWQDPVTVQGSSFMVDLSNLNLPVSSTYQFSLQAYTSVNDSPYVLSFQSVVPAAVTLQPAPVVPGLVTIKPALSLDLAQQLAANWTGAIDAANNNSGNIKPFQQPDASTWNNSLQGVAPTSSFLIVPCTTAYCKTLLSDSYAMLILAWPVATPLSQAQMDEIKKTCSSVTSPSVSYAVYSGDTLVGNRLTGGAWLQPVPSDPTIVTTFQIVAYVWSASTGDEGIEKSACTSQPLNVVVQVPTDLYSASTCFSIQPFKPQGSFIPGNFMLYHPGSNKCSSPEDSVEALSARDFSCLVNGTAPPTLTNMQLYGCNDTPQAGTNCNSSGQGCVTVSPVTTVRQPELGESNQCPPPSDNQPPCEGSEYCQLAACNCPASVPWYLCGAFSFAQVGTGAAIEASRWQDRVSNVSNFIKFYGLDKVSDVQTFLNNTSSPQNIQTVWDSTYGTAVCPLPNNWNAPTPGNCDITSPTAWNQTSVCNAWEPTNGLYKRQVYTYPTSQDGAQSACCPSKYTYYSGCCCPDTNNKSNCTPLAAGTLGPTWCKTKT